MKCLHEYTYIIVGARKTNGLGVQKRREWEGGNNCPGLPGDNKGVVIRDSIIVKSHNT